MTTQYFIKSKNPHGLAIILEYYYTPRVMYIMNLQ